MVNKTYSVLIIDDHPLIAEAYKAALHYFSKENESIKFLIEVAQNCDSAEKQLRFFSENKRNLDVVFLDISLPPSKDGRLVSGEDIGLKINKLMPDTKIVVSTTLNDNHRIHSIFKSLNPDGFLIKNDINSLKLIDCISMILNDTPYYSKSVINLLRKQVTNDYLLDNIDRKILYELSIGTKMKDLPDIVPLSMAGIEKRKRQLKQIFNVSSSDDKELLYLSKEKGFI